MEQTKPTCLEAVSYTHLDVYKRQRANIPNQASPLSFFANSKISGIFSRILL